MLCLSSSAERLMDYSVNLIDAEVSGVKRTGVAGI